MPKITAVTRETKNTVYAKTKSGPEAQLKKSFKWWLADSKKDLTEQVLSTVGFLKEQQNHRYRQASIFSRLYGNMPLANFIGSSMGRAQSGVNLPMDRPTMNVVQSCVDTLVSRITQSKPRPMFLTDNASYKERKLAKQMNNFIDGEIYQTKGNEHAKYMLRDASILGDGVIKIYEGPDKRVAMDRVLCTELLVDANDGFYRNPRQLFQLKLVDRSVLQDIFPEVRAKIAQAEEGYPDTSGESQQTASDQVMIAEGWHLPSGPDAGDGRHVIICTAGVILDEPFTKKKFPFVFFPYSPRLVGFWAQGLAEQLMGTQVEINKLLMTISQSINLVGVPRVFVEDGSKVVKAHLNNQVGSIVTYRGTKPSYEVAPCVPQELYAQLERLVNYAYQQSGISALAATSQKPAGLNSGEAIRNYDDLQSDRFADLSDRWNKSYIEIAYLITDTAKDIAQRDGKYSTVYPNKDGTKEIDLPAADLLEDPVIQCFDASSLPREPAGRLQKVTEMMQSGLISPQEGRRLLSFPDIEQVDKLENAGEERILQILDNIIETGKFEPADPFMDIALAEKLCVQYYNLYVPAKLEEKKAQLLRDFFAQLQNLKQAAQPPPMAAPGIQPQAAPMPQPTSDLIPNVPPQAA